MKHILKGVHYTKKAINTTIPENAEVWCDDEKIVNTYKGNALSAEEATEYAQLLAESANVFNSTGFTPLQLAEQRQQLLEALKTITAQFETYKESNAWDESDEKVLNETVQLIEAINTATK